jgi:hypothetical protein
VVGGVLLPRRGPEQDLVFVAEILGYRTGHPSVTALTAVPQMPLVVVARLVEALPVDTMETL